MNLSHFKIENGKIIYFILLVLFVLLALGGFYRIQEKKIAATSPLVTIGAKTYFVEIANSDASREKGLSGRNMLNEDSGMLFVFSTPNQYGFWMKDTLIPLDMIWIGEDKHIVHIEKNVLPESYPTLYSPEEDALYVLELNAGEVEKNFFTVGDQVSIFLPESH